MALFKANALFLEIGEAPDADAITYINVNNITRLQQQAGICRLVKFLKDKSLWTTLSGGFLFGNRVGASSGTSLPDLKGGTAATLTGGSHEVNGIYMNGNNADEISFGARTFTNNYMPSVYVLFASYNTTGTATSSRLNFGPFTSNSTYRGFMPHTHSGTGSATLVQSQAYRGDGNRYLGTGSLSVFPLNANFVGTAFSSSNQLILGGQNANVNNATSTIAAPMTFAAGATWLLGPFEQASKTSTELTTASACLFWNSDTALTPQFVSQLDSLLREFVC
jgi:hypothetical protein